MPPSLAVCTFSMTLRVVEPAGIGAWDGNGEGSNGGVTADSLDEQGNGRAVALGGGLGEVFDDGPEDLQVAGQMGTWGRELSIGLGLFED